MLCLRKAAECQTRTGRKEEGRRIGKTSFWGDRAACSSLFPSLPKLLFGFFSLPVCARKLFFCLCVAESGKKSRQVFFSSSPPLFLIPLHPRCSQTPKRLTDEPKREAGKKQKRKERGGVSGVLFTVCALGGGGEEEGGEGEKKQLTLVAPLFSFPPLLLSSNSPTQ